jgi:hypothetical protein
MGAALERWPADFLSVTRASFKCALEETTKTISRERLTEQSWPSKHARRIVDRLGDLLEIAWMAEMAARHANTDSTAAVLTSLAGYYLLEAEEPFEHPVLEALDTHASSLIDEKPLQTDVALL